MNIVFVYASFLGFGLMSARMSIFAYDTLYLYPESNSSNFQLPRELTSVCLPVNKSFSWIQQGVEYIVSGPKYKELNSFHSCYKSTIKIIKNKIKAPVELRDKEIYAFSFYYDRLKSANLLINENGGVVQLSDILDKALASKIFRIFMIVKNHIINRIIFYFFSLSL
jgi:hypothetical protein